MEYQHITYEIIDHVALVVLNRPERLNAFTRLMREELIQMYARAEADDEVRAIVVTGAGRAFCAGMDLGEGGNTFNYTNKGEHTSNIDDHRDGGGRVSLAAWRCKKPIIAAINGAAVGVGLTMTLAMDIRVAAEDAKVGFVFAQRGVCPEACSTYFLPRLVGPGKAIELCATGRLFTPADERHSGLFNHVVPRNQVHNKAMFIAREIAGRAAPVSVALAKKMLQSGLGDHSPEESHLTESRCFWWVGKQPDAAEGIQSFLEKRAPRFTMSPVRDLPEKLLFGGGDE